MANSVLLESPHLNSTAFPLKTSGSSSQAYILSLTSLPGHYAASASAPSNTIDIFDKTTLQGIQTLSGHDTATTSLIAVDRVANITARSLISSGRDGSVKVWDERSNTPSIKMINSRPLLCCDVSPDGLTVAAGTELQGEDALIVYWDPRKPGIPLHTHGSTHSDDITALSFSTNNPESHNIILSASSDGLVSTSNADEDDEDEAVLQVGNWGCSISQAGWIHGTDPAIWASSDMETFSTWSDELDQLQSVDIRNPSVHNHRRTWVTDYLIGCHSTHGAPSLRVFVGSNEGDVALLSNSNLSVPDAPWTLQKLWTNGHIGVVRSMLWDETNSVLVTGGEDSKINVWPSLPAESSSEYTMDVDPPSRKRDLDRDEEQVHLLLRAIA